MLLAIAPRDLLIRTVQKITPAANFVTKSISGYVCISAILYILMPKVTFIMDIVPQTLVSYELVPP
jgi:hypothetical protein